MDRQYLNWKQILLTGLVTGAVTVLTGMALFKWQQREPRLSFSLSDTIPFEGQDEQLAIYHVSIQNEGKREVEDVLCSVDVSPAAIKKYRVKADATLKHSEVVSNSVIQFQANGLNPNEEITLSVLASSTNAIPTRPVVSLRGKDVMGVAETRTDRESAVSWPWAPALVAAYAGLSVGSLFLLRRRPHIFGGLLGKRIASIVDSEHHSDDQNEILAYLFGLHGMPEQVEYYLRKAEGCSYWAESDRLASMAVESNNPDNLRKCASILHDLLNYAESSPISQGIIHYNLARIATKLNLNAEVEQHLSDAKKLIPKLLKTRLSLDPLFKK
jgi:hypothetical protein